MRCFIAIDLPENLKEELNKLRENFNERIANITWVEEPHLTLKFLGEISKAELERVKTRLEKIRFKTFKLKLSKIGFFPNSRFIRVIWVGITPKRKIIELKQSIDDALMELFPRDREFEPHITIGRVKTIRDKDKFLEFFNKEVDEEFKAEKFKLIKTELSGERANYSILGEYK